MKKLKDTTSKIIFTSDQKEFDDIRKRLIKYFNTPKIFLNIRKTNIFLIEEIFELEFSKLTGIDSYFIDCLVNYNNKKERMTYSIDPKLMNNFFRSEKLKKIKSKI